MLMLGESGGGFCSQRFRKLGQQVARNVWPDLGGKGGMFVVVGIKIPKLWIVARWSGKPVREAQASRSGKG